MHRWTYFNRKIKNIGRFQMACSDRNGCPLKDDHENPDKTTEIQGHTTDMFVE
jgi:hypothetical protein